MGLKKRLRTKAEAEKLAGPKFVGGSKFVGIHNWDRKQHFEVCFMEAHLSKPCF